jgi:DnaJ-class molecular chaperone
MIQAEIKENCQECGFEYETLDRGICEDCSHMKGKCKHCDGTGHLELNDLNFMESNECDHCFATGYAH